MVSCTTLIIKEAEVMLKSMPMKHDGAIWDQLSKGVWCMMTPIWEAPD